VGELQLALADIWAHALHIEVDELSTSDHFFDLGGHSLLAIKTTLDVETQFQIRLNPADLLTNDFTGFAQRVEAACSRAAGEPKKTSRWDRVMNRLGFNSKSRSPSASEDSRG